MATPAIVWRSDATAVLADQLKILENLKRIQEQGANLGGPSGANTILDVDKMSKAYKSSSDQIVKEIERQQAAIAMLDDVQRKYAKGGKAAAEQFVTGRAGQHLASVLGMGEVSDLKQVRPPSPYNPRIGPNLPGPRGSEALKQAAELARKEIEKLDGALVQLNETAHAQSLETAKQLDPALYAEMNRLVLQRGDYERRAAKITGGEAVNEVLRDRMGMLREELKLLESQRSALVANAKTQLAPKQQRMVSSAQANIDAEAKAADGLSAAYKEIDRIFEQSGLARAKQSAMRTGLSNKDAKVVGDVIKNIQSVNPQAAAQLETQIGLVEKYGKAFADANAPQKEGGGLQKSIQEAIGADPALAHLTEQIDNVKKAMVETTTASTETLFPGIEDDIRRLAEIERKLSRIKNLQSAEAQRLQAEREDVTNQAQTKIASGQATFAATQPLSPDQMMAELSRQLPILERTFVQVFSDMQRRFIATFQFAISGALIFGTVKMVKEFYQTAVEVERAFADIESALEFDIAEPRGSAAFKSQVEGVRQEVLKLAAEFNVLPTEANKSAFVMISRFTDMGNAMKATRAQLLAVKVSTIDQSETLRALTAVSEGFAAVQLEVNEGLNLQERLMAKEAASAELYGKALDLAVTIQQKFGVEVEDTLEGTARATEVFRQMGFTMEETAAIVASTSRQLGQTGQQAAERLVRSLGQLTDPKIRDALLDLAAGSTEFSLGISDFESGAKAWETITRQFSRLEGSAPDVARAILQIVGQRRELEAVAAALGTNDLQREMLVAAESAAGAAETRFSYLSQTVAEMMNSIRTGFQEMAQNFERLGGLQTMKLLLKGVDNFVGALNTALKLVIDFVHWMDRFTLLGRGIGSMATQIAAVTLAAYGLLRVAIALQKTFLLLSGSAGIAKLAAAMSVTQGVSVGAAAGAGGGLAAPIAAGFGARMGAFAVAAGKGTTAMLGMIPVWGWMAAAVIGTGLAINSVKERSERLSTSFEEGSANVIKATHEARRRIREEGLVGLEAREFSQQSLVDALTAATTASQSGSPSNVEFIGAYLKDLVSVINLPTETARWAVGLGGLSPADNWRQQSLVGMGQARAHPELEEGASELWQDLTDKAMASLVDTQKEAISREMAGFNFDEVDLASLSKMDMYDLTSLVPSYGKGAFDPKSVQADVLRMYADSAQAYADDLPEKGALLAYLAAEKWDMFLAILGKLPANMTKSMTGLSTELAGLDTKVALGQMTAEEAIAAKLRIAQEMEDQARKAQIQWPNMKEEWTQWFQDAADAQLEGMRAAIAELSFQQDTGGDYGEGTKERLERQIAQFEESSVADPENYQEKTYGDFRGAPATTGVMAIPPEVQAKWDENEERIRELAENEILTAITVAEHAVAMAEGLDAEEAAAAQLNEAFAAAIALYEAWGNSEEKVSEYVRRIESNNKKSKADGAADARRLAEARVRMSGKILDPILAIQATIAGIRAELAAGGLEAGEALALQVELNEAIAHEAQAQQEKIRAYGESQISVRNSVKQNQFELTMLARELALTAELFGRGSVEWSNVKKAMENMKAALMDQALELESINRMLAPGVDLTDAYQKSQLALIDAIQQQKAVYADLDAGDLEKARADLAVAEATIADQAAFAQDRLFTMKFDYDRGAISKGQYIASLKKYLSEIDTTSRAGKELWSEINGLIEGMTGDLSDMQFNIPGEIRLPTLFEVRRALTADALGVNYQDNRTQDIRIYVDSDVDVAKVANAVNEGLGSQAATASARYAPGSATLTLGV